jgi:EmrB/QacA subfamily drug resistance transporter
VSDAGSIAISSHVGRGALASTVLASGMVFLDGTIANVATEKIGAEFSASFAGLQWVLNGYALALASLILLGGSLGDHYGRRAVYLTGIVWFASASLLCAVAPSIQVLIAARVLQGIGGALLAPGSLSLIQASFRPSDTARAVGVWSGMTGIATAAGPLLGGYLVQHVSWRWAFGINAPLAVAAVIMATRFVPESKSHEDEGPLDLRGTALIVLGLGALTYGTTIAGETGWGALAYGCTAAGLVLLSAFALVESKFSHPVLPPGLFRNRCFTGTNIMTFTTYGALGATLFLFVLNLQVTGHYGALAAGLSTLPLTLMMLLLSARSGALAARIGPRPQLVLGPLIASAGIALTLLFDAQHRTYWVYVLPGMLVFALGLACLVAPLTATVMGSVPTDEVGVASGTNNAVSRTASLLSVAVLPPLAGLTGERYRLPEAMSHGYRVVAVICIGLLILGAVAVTLTVPRRLREEPVDVT